MLGYGIETTAQEAGVSKNSVLRAEHEEDIRPVTARKIAAALDVRVADLIGESETLKVQPRLPNFNSETREHAEQLARAVEAEGVETIFARDPVLADRLLQLHGLVDRHFAQNLREGAG